MFPLEGCRQTAMNRPSLPSSCTHTHLQCYRGLHTHRCVCLTAQVLTGQREILPETPAIKVHPSFCTDVSVPCRKLQLGCSTKAQALPMVASEQEQQHCSKLSLCTSFSHPASAQTPAELCSVSSTTARQFCPFSFI